MERLDTVSKFVHAPDSPAIFRKTPPIGRGTEPAPSPRRPPPVTPLVVSINNTYTSVTLADACGRVKCYYRLPIPWYADQHDDRQDSHGQAIPGEAAQGGLRQPGGPACTRPQSAVQRFGAEGAGRPRGVRSRTKSAEARGSRGGGRDHQGVRTALHLHAGGVGILAARPAQHRLGADTARARARPR